MLRWLPAHHKSGNSQQSFFQQHIYGMKNCLAVFGIEANRISVDNEQIAVGYIEGDYLFLKSLHCGSTMITLSCGDRQARIQLVVNAAGVIHVQVSPYIEKVATV